MPLESVGIRTAFYFLICQRSPPLLSLKEESSGSGTFLCQVGSKPRLICESNMGDIISFDWFCPPLIAIME